MAEITAAAVKELREKCGLPMMDCKKALGESDGNVDAAIQWLRERGAQILAKRADRETTYGRFGIYTSIADGQGAMVELMCESASVTQNEEFIQLANDLAQQLATGPGAADSNELLEQPSPSKDGMTLLEQRDELFNRIREVFNIGRTIRIDGSCGGYSHNATTVSGVLMEVEGGNDVAARDVCMHIAAMRPAALAISEIPEDEVEKERSILREAALAEGKPENIVDKMVDGRIRNYFAERVLSEQQYVKGDKETVSEFAAEHGMTLKKFVLWELGDS